MSRENQTGKFITFYSYKGGTGRSMALANVGYLLSLQQSDAAPVLMIDWDLEAPGLHRYFPIKNESVREKNSDTVLGNSVKHLGLIDLFNELDKLTPDNYAKDSDEAERQANSVLNEIDIGKFITHTEHKGLDLMIAGHFDSDYPTKVNTFNWEELYNRSPFLFTAFVEKLSERYSYILVDSRTGITDISGVCTSLLPEILVVVFTPNLQSLDGVENLVRRATSYRQRSDDLRPLLVYPLPSRIEDSEPIKQANWRFGSPSLEINGYQPRFEELLKDVYDLEDCDLTEYFDKVQIQQTPPYAYGEDIAALVERKSERLSLSQAYTIFLQWLNYGVGPWEILPIPSVEQLSDVRIHLAEQKNIAFSQSVELRKQTRRTVVFAGLGLIGVLAGASGVIWQLLPQRRRPRFVNKKLSNFVQTSFSRGFYQNDMSNTVHYVDSGGKILHVGEINEQNLKRLKVDVLKLGDTLPNLHVNISQLSIAAENEALVSVRDGDFEKACALLDWGIAEELGRVSRSRNRPNFRLLELLAGISIRYGLPKYTTRVVGFLQAYRKVFPQRGIAADLVFIEQKIKDENSPWYLRWREENKRLLWNGVQFPPFSSK